MPPVFSSPGITIIHCGASRTALGVFHLSAGRLRCGHFAAELFPALAAGEDHWLEHTTAALQALNAGRQWAGPAVLVLPAHLTLTKQVKVPQVQPAKRAKIIRFEAEQAIPHPLNEVIWASVPCGQRETDEDIILVAARREIIDQVCSVAQAAGFEPCRILPSALATLAGFRLVQPGLARPALILNLGGRSTTLLQVDGARFAVRTLALGGASITQQLAENQDCDPVEAEQIKLSERNAGLVADALQAFVARLGPEISRSVTHFARESGLAHPAQVFLAGGGARLAGLDEALAERLKIPVAHHETRSAVAMSLGSAAAATVPAGLDDLVGAAALVLLPAQPVVDLLPPALRQRAGLRRRQPWLIAAALLVVVALVPPIIHYRQMTTTVRAKITAMEKALAPLRTREARIRANLAQLGLIKARVAQLQALHTRQTTWLRLFAGLQERLVKVEDVWFEKLQAIPPAEGVPMKLAVSGRMLDRTDPSAQDSGEAIGRVKQLLAGISGLPEVKAVEGERFDPSVPGLLRFDFILVIDPTHPL